MIGRKTEISLLNDLKKKETASLVCIRGRRRIGKSTLVKYFSQSFDNYFELQGLAPQHAINNEQQLAHFASSMSKHFNIPIKNFSSWSEAFSTLARLTRKKRYLIFLDEISWMGKYDLNFPGHLKIAWDTEFKENNKLIFIICGSVSTWINDNILNNTGFVGRLSLNIRLQELSLKESIELLFKRSSIPLLRINNAKKQQSIQNSLSDFELIKLLSFTGGVPKYLEEVSIKNSAEQNIERLILNKSGALFYEFEQIFNDIFHKNSKHLQSILLKISANISEPKELATALNIPYNGSFSNILNQLDESGFIKKYQTWDIKTKKESNLTRYRIADNYIHFFLKNVFPIKNRIEKLPMKIAAIKNWESIIGYQFENIVHNNYLSLISLLKITPEEILQIGPYFQRRNLKHEGVQIDLLIQTKFNTLYLCELKCKNKIDRSVEIEVSKKIKALKGLKNYSIRAVLVYCGEISSELENSSFFSNIVSFSELWHGLA